MAARHSLRRLFGDVVDVRYHDLDAAGQHEAHAELLASFEEEGWPLPVTMMDGAVLFVGGLQPAKLVAAVAQELGRHGIKPMG